VVPEFGSAGLPFRYGDPWPENTAIPYVEFARSISNVTRMRSELLPEVLGRCKSDFQATEGNTKSHGSIVYP